MQLVLTWLKGALIIVIAAFCFAAGILHTHTGAGWHNFSTIFPGARGGFSGFMVALIAALWAYDGWSDVTQMAGEIQQPQRSLPIALIGGITIVGGLYMLTNAAIQFVLPATAIATADRPTVHAMLLVAGTGGAALVTLGMAISMAATFVGSSLSGARVSFAASRDGLFFAQLAHVNKRFRTPDASLIVQALLATLLLLAISKFQALFSLAIFADWLFYALAASTVFVFRRRDRNSTRVFSMWGYPVVPALFIAAAAVLVVFSLIDQPRNSLTGALVILLGVPLHLVLKRRGGRANAPQTHG